MTFRILNALGPVSDGSLATQTQAEMLRSDFCKIIFYHRRFKESALCHSIDEDEWSLRFLGNPIWGNPICGSLSVLLCFVLWFLLKVHLSTEILYKFVDLCLFLLFLSTDFLYTFFSPILWSCFSSKSNKRYLAGCGGGGMFWTNIRNVQKTHVITESGMDRKTYPHVRLVLRWEWNWGPRTWKAGKQTTEPTWSPM